MKQVYHPYQPRVYKHFPQAKPGHKYCVDCEIEKPFDAFHKMKASPDGYRPTCKKCRKKPKEPSVPVQHYLFLVTKICSKCRKEKDIEEFNKMKSGINGYHSHCKECQSKYNHKLWVDNLEENRARSRTKNTTPANRARKMERHRERSISDPEYREYRKQARQKYYRNHRDQAQEYVLKRRSRILNAAVDQVSIKRILERDGYTCHICGNPIDPDAKKRSAASLCFDHVIPLHPRPGEPQGTHSEDNIKPAHCACNVRKGNRPLDILTAYDRRGVN